MKARALFGTGILAALACARPSEVELRLYRCPELQQPTGVRLEIQGYDGGDAEAGPHLSKTFTIADPAVFSDGYATVGYVPAAGVVTADITVVWQGGKAEATASYMKLPVPALGEAIVLGDEACAGAGSTGDGTTSVPTTGATETGTTGTSGGTSTGSTGTTTGDGTTSTSGATETGTTGTGTDGTTMGTTGTTGPSPGDPCPGLDGSIACVDGVDKVGSFVLCQGGEWMSYDALTICNDPLTQCDKVMNPTVVGCFGVGVNHWACACQSTEACANEGEVTCMMDTLDLCLMNESMMLVHHVGYCACGDVDGHTTCK